jgi:hypothetical protein
MSPARILNTGPALLILFLVTAGLFTMHTLGHFTSPAAHSSGHGAMPATHHVDHAVVHADRLPLAAPAPEEPELPMGSMVMCVAILSALTVLAMAAIALLRRSGGRSLLAQLGARRVVDAVRGPPAIPIGLTLTNLSVLRT